MKMDLKKGETEQPHFLPKRQRGFRRGQFCGKMKKYKVVVNQLEYLVEVMELPTNGKAYGEKTQESAAAASKPIGPGATIKAPLMGTVLSVKAKEGQKVQSGDIILTLEALKLENEIVAPRAGTITAIHVGEGESVEVGDVLFVME